MNKETYIALVLVLLTAPVWAYSSPQEKKGPYAPVDQLNVLISYEGNNDYQVIDILNNDIRTAPPEAFPETGTEMLSKNFRPHKVWRKHRLSMEPE